ncbi:MAG TPA: DUF2142 domain-containing protein [Acidimicrobiales bacterium]|nr:DUF2142 domain-containing protein [Acidimicrobiales bacterium]
MAVPSDVGSRLGRVWRGDLTRRTQWWVTWLLLFGIIALWSVSGPLFSGPDEPSHVVKAAAVARGQLVGEDRQVGFEHDPSVRTGTVVRVPQVFADGHRMPSCYAFRPEITAGCAGAFGGSAAEAEVPTFAGHYQPAYYAVVGLPSLVFTSASGVFLMRLAGAAVCAALLASAFASASSSRRPTELVLGTALAMTPMVVYIASVVNPSALEISAALCVWVSTLVLMAGLDEGGSRRLVVRIGVSGALLALSRGLSPLWLLVIALVALTVARRETLADLARRRDVRLCAVALVAAAAVASAWLVLAGTLQTREPPRDATTSVAAAVRASLGDTDTDLREMIGWYGWLDVDGPALTRHIWLGAVGAAVLGAFTAAGRRYVVALALLLTSVVVLPVVVEAIQVGTLGLFWQGRYTLPLAVGVPPLAALAIADRVRARPEVLSRLATVLLGALALGQVLAYAIATRRYSVGALGPVMYVLGDDAWQPPVPTWALLAALVVAVGLLALWLHRLATQSATTVDIASTPPATDPTSAGLARP